MTRILLPWLPWLLLVSSCSSPPKLPAVDESRKRPVNTAMAVELQSCRSDLENTRIAAGEHARTAQTNALAMARLAQQQVAIASAAAAQASAQRNLLVPVRFDFGSTRLSLPETEKSRIVDAARAAPLIVLRGRTDGTVESPAESDVARRRAAVVEDWLVQAGVDRARIRATWQPTGDHAADNTLPGGRALNRRVEIEFYRAAPIFATVEALPTDTERGAAAPR